MDLETLLASKDPEHWETVRQLILTDQVPMARVIEIFLEHHEFGNWCAKQDLASHAT